MDKYCSCLVSLFFGWSYFVFVIFPEESENDPCHLTASRSHTTVSGKGDFPVWSSRFYYCICWPSLLWLTFVTMTVISLGHGPGILKIFWEEFDYSVGLKFLKEQHGLHLSIGISVITSGTPVLRSKCNGKSFIICSYFCLTTLTLYLGLYLTLRVWHILVV